MLVVTRITLLTKRCAPARTGHAEVVEITFDPDIITYDQLLEIFMATHDPTILNRQGGNIGESYRSIIFYLNDEQKKEAANIITQLSDESIFENDIVTEIKKLDKFYPAEDYHHNYFAKNPDQAYCQSIINPKIKKFKAKYHEYLKK